MHLSHRRPASSNRAVLPRLRSTALGVVAAVALIGSGLAATPAFAASVTTAVFSGTGTVTNNGTVFTKSGTALTLTVSTSSDTQCVDVAGSFTGHQESTTAKSTWTFSTTAPAAEGAYGVTASASSMNKQSKCTGPSATVPASYTVDNTGPVISYTLNPAPTNDGWTNANTTVTWTATDAAGIGNVSGPDTVNANGTSSSTGNATDRLGNSSSRTISVNVDKNAPTIKAGAPTGTVGTNGWFTSPTTVKFTCGDATSGIASCLADGTTGDSKTITSSGTVTGTATDKAGNTATASSGALKVDTTAPVLSGAPTTSPNGNGWYKGDVAVHWTASDPESSVSAPADSTITGEGSALSVSKTVTNGAGVSTTATSSPTVKIDRTAPTTSITGTSNSWTNSTSVTVSLQAVDNLSGVASTSYSIDGGTIQTGTSFSLSTEGDHTISFFSTDNAGNVEVANTAHVKIDRTAPTIGHAFTPLAYTDGAWTNKAVTVTFTCADQGSGVASCSPAVTKTTEGSYTIPGTATDNAGNTATDSANVRIDTTAPVLTATPDSAPNDSGWYNHDVTVTFAADDAVSGIASAPAAQVLTEGTDQSASGTATDKAGNSTTASVDHVNIDETKPVLTGSVSDGWHTGDVTVQWTCTDALSGVASQPADTVVTGEGSDLSATTTCTDKAGNTATKTVSGIEIDRHAPLTTASVPDPNGNGWYGAPVSVTLKASDNGSGVATTYYSVDGGAAKTYSAPFSFSTEGTHTISSWSTDVAGNVEVAGAPLTLRVDTTAPVTTIINPISPANGWFVDSGIPFAFSASDGSKDVSGVATTYYRIDKGDAQTYGQPFSQNLSDGAHTVTYWSVDAAGNAEQSRTVDVAVDSTKPTITGAPTTAANGNGWYKQPVTVHFTCADDGSGLQTGIAGCSPDAVVKNEGPDQSVTGDAFDNAGNHSSATVGGINLDQTAPTLTGVPTTQANANGWYHSDVTVHWQGDDGLSGIDSSTQPSDTTVTGEGADLTATSAPIEDQAGNASEPGIYALKIDRTAPSISGGTMSDANSNGWYSTPVTVHFTCRDALSGLESCPSDTAVSAEGADQTVKGTATDKAGNAASAKVDGINLDRTKPLAGYLLSEAPNAAGWYHGDVVVTWNGTDSLSGVDQSSVHAPTTITASGTDVGTDSVTVVDLAGNESDPVSVQHLKIDRLAPTISGAPTTAANAAGWYRSSVTMRYSCTDDLSGMAICPADTVLSSEAADQSITSSTASDVAGNTTAGGYTISGISIDTTKPTLAPVVDAPSRAGWYNSPVTVTWKATDSLSGVDNDTLPTPVTFDTEGTGFGTGDRTVKDVAGNTSDAASVSGIKIDMAGPSISATPTTSPNAAGWYNHAVTFDYTCVDPKLADGSDGSGVASCPTSDTISGDGAGQFRTSSSATDVAGNTTPGIATANVNIDGAAPSSSSSTLCSGNAGWCTGTTAMVNISATDQAGLSGVKEIHYVVNGGAEQVVPGNAAVAGVPLSGTGNGTVTYWAVDNAGNVEQTHTAALKWDTIDPVVTHTISPTPNAAGWTHDDTTVTFSATDDANGSGLVADSITAPQVLRNETTTDGVVVNGSASDVAGNTGTDTATVKLDKTKPTISASLSGIAGNNGWWRSAVTAHFSCFDALSGIAKTGCPDAATMSTEGANSVTRTVDDVAGNTGSTTVDGVNIDTIAPSIGHTMSSVPNAAGWYNAPVTVTFSGKDGGSGVDATTAPVTVSTDTTADGTTVNGTVTDKAGNSSADSATVKLDQVAPTITAEVTSGTLGNNGWYTGPVTVSFTCSDALSGIPTGTCPASQKITTDGPSTATAFVADAAGNIGTASLDLKIDQTPPTVSHTVSGGYTEGSWTNQPVTVSFSGDDHGGSGIASVTSPVTVSTQTTADGTTVSGTATDNAGNTSAADAVNVKLDTTKPTITAKVISAGTPNADGWYNAAVTVGFTCADDLSGVVKCPDPVTVSANGTNTASGTVSDVAGNSATAALAIKIDTTGPTLTTANVNIQGGTYTLGAVPAPTCSAKDDLSGLASCTVTLTGGGNASGVGTFTYSATAIDKVGNPTTITGSYKVIYRWDGFLQPVNDTAHQIGTTTSVFKAGSTIPMKLQLKNAAGTVVKSVAAPEWLTPVKGSAMTVAVNDTSSAVLSDSGSAFTYDATGQQYQYNWKTPSTSGYWYTAGVKFDDGQTYFVTIGLK